MTSYKCPRCYYETVYINNYRKHLSRKVPCNPDHSDQSPPDILNRLAEDKQNSKEHIFCCEHCNKQFNSSQGKYQHKLRCKSKKTNEDLQKQINELTILIKKQAPTIQNITINNNNQQYIQNNNQQNNIKIENFGTENLEFISDRFIRQCLKKLSTGFEDLTQKIHFNPEKPEYHNVTTRNKKDYFLEIFKDGKWIYTDKNKTLDALIKQCFDVLSSHYDEYENEIRAEMSSMRFKQVDQFVESVLNQDKTIQSQLRKCMYLLILNERNMIQEKQSEH